MGVFRQWHRFVAGRVWRVVQEWGIVSVPMATATPGFRSAILRTDGDVLDAMRPNMQYWRTFIRLMADCVQEGKYRKFLDMMNVPTLHVDPLPECLHFHSWALLSDGRLQQLPGYQTLSTSRLDTTAWESHDPRVVCSEGPYVCDECGCMQESPSERASSPASKLCFCAGPALDLDQMDSRVMVYENPKCGFGLLALKVSSRLLCAG